MSHRPPEQTPSDPAAAPDSLLHFPAGHALTPLEDARDPFEFEQRLAELALSERGLAMDTVRIVRAPDSETSLGRSWMRETGGDRALAAAVRPLASLPSDRTAALEAVLAQVAKADAPVVAESRGTLAAGRSLGAVAIGTVESRFGILAGEWEAGVSPVPSESELVRFAAAIARAFEVFRRGHEARRRAEQALALEEMARAAVTPRNLAEVLQLAVRLAVRGTGADGGVVWSCVEGLEPRIEAAHGAPASRECIAIGIGGVAAEAAHSVRPQVVSSPRDDLRVSTDAVAALAGCAVWPLAAYGRARGALAVYVESRSAAGFTFENWDRQFLTALADLVALAADHADRFTELRDMERREREARTELRRRERLATVGRLAAQAARESAAPVATIRAFASRALRAADLEATRECLEVVLREVGRLERVLDEQRAHAEVEPPSLKLASLNDAADRSLQELGETLVRRRVRLVKRLGADLPPLLLDARRIGQAVDNLVRFALDSVGIGGRVRIETRRSANHVVLELAHDGARTAGDVLDQLFVPFSTSRPGGPGVGLGVAQRIVQEHGGEIRVRAEGEWSTVFSFTLPIVGNQDRRQTPLDRRLNRPDRRS